MSFPSRFSIRAFLGRTNAERRIALKEIAYRRRYLVPNLVTLGNMFCGYLAIMYAVTGRMSHAFWAVFIALILDGLDGRVARKLNATSPFGMEFDSFSDLVSFGVAPAVMIYHWSMHSQAQDFGIFISFIYLTCAASRLARFNISTSNLHGFTGLPTPGAAGAAIALIHFIGTSNPDVTNNTTILWLSSACMICLAVLMVSKISFFSIKTLNFRRPHILLQFASASILALIWYNHRIGLFVLAFSYVLSGPVIVVFSKPKIRFSLR